MLVSTDKRKFFGIVGFRTVVWSDMTTENSPNKFTFFLSSNKVKDDI